MELSRIKMELKDKFKHFNQIFLTLENKIPNDSMPTKNLQIVYNVRALIHDIVVWVKIYHKTTLQQAFDEAIIVEKDMISLTYTPETKND